MTPLSKVQQIMAERTKRGGGPSVRTDAGGNPVFVPLRRTIDPVALAAIAQLPRKENNNELPD